MKPQPPKNVMRRRVCAFLEENPGACLQEVANHLGVHRNAAAHHISRLVRRGLVTRETAGRRKIHFVQGADPPGTARRANAVLRLSTARKVLEALLEDPTTSWRGLARSIGVSPNTIRWQVQRLQDEGLLHVVAAPVGRGHEVVLHPEVRDMLDDDTPPPSDESGPRLDTTTWRFGPETA